MSCWKCFTKASVSARDMREAATLWNYLKLNHKLQKSDVILVFGNHDVRTAEYAARLWMDGWAEWLMFSGDTGTLTKGKWTKTEAEVFSAVAIGLGVPSNMIILETKAKNTGENVVLSYGILQTMELDLNRFILVQMPHMGRRTYATFMKQWPENTSTLSVVMASPDIPLHEFPNDDVGTMSDVIAVMLGCMQRIHQYPEMGFQIQQHIPDRIWAAYQQLRTTGRYNGHSLLTTLGLQRNNWHAFSAFEGESAQHPN